MGKLIRRLRREREIPLRVVAERCKIAASYLCEVELGRRPPFCPSHPAYDVMAELFEVDAAELRRAATEQRQFLVEGVSWRSHNRPARP